MKCQLVVNEAIKKLPNLVGCSLHLQEVFLRRQHSFDLLNIGAKVFHGITLYVLHLIKIDYKARLVLPIKLVVIHVRCQQIIVRKEL